MNEILGNPTNIRIARVLGVLRVTHIGNEVSYDGENYVEDLNAMHVAEKSIAPFYTGVRPNDTDYDKNLRLAIVPTADSPIRVPTFKASATQRAEAFLATME